MDLISGGSRDPLPKRDSTAAGFAFAGVSQELCQAAWGAVFDAFSSESADAGPLLLVALGPQPESRLFVVNLFGFRWLLYSKQEDRYGTYQRGGICMCTYIHLHTKMDFAVDTKMGMSSFTSLSRIVCTEDALQGLSVPPNACCLPVMPQVDILQES